MNITHAKSEEVKGDRLCAIFDRQHELMEKYHHIEERSGLCQTSDVPVNIDSREGQARIKDFSWRFIEEMGEALDAQYNDKEHYHEELLDALHFLTELTILVDIDPFSLIEMSGKDDEDQLDILYNNAKLPSTTYEGDVVGCMIMNDLVREIGMMCNCLKNKPWKQSMMKTDQNNFYSQLEKVWLTYFSYLKFAKLTPDSIVDIYLKKSQVNKFRQRSNY